MFLKHVCKIKFKYIIIFENKILFFESANLRCNIFYIIIILILFYNRQNEMRAV